VAAAGKVGSIAATESGAIVGLSLTRRDFRRTGRRARRDARTPGLRGGFIRGASGTPIPHCVPCGQVTARKTRGRVKVRRGRCNVIASN